MEVNALLALIVGVVGIGAGLMWLTGKSKAPIVKGKTSAMVLSLVVLFVAAGMFYAAVSPQGYKDNFPLLPSLFTTSGKLSAGTTDTSDPSPAELPARNAGQYGITAFKSLWVEDGSNSPTAVSGTLKVFDAAANPSNANANPIASITVAGGTGNDTTGALISNTPYRVVLDGGSTYYDKDFGVMSFSSAGFNPNTAGLTFQGGKVQKVATLADILDETSTAGIIDGVTGVTNGSKELGCGAVSTGCSADGTLVYNETAGDGLWTIDVTPAFTGGNTFSHKPVLAFKFDPTNPPEGNEYTSITAQLMSGTDMNVPSDITNFWLTQTPIALGDNVPAGKSATYRLTFSEVAANEDGNDKWTLRFDDLGDFNGRDVMNGYKATADTVTYGGSIV